MNKEEIEKWCEENNYLLVDLTKKTVPAEIVIKIAESSTYIDDIKKKNNGEEYTFARYMASAYLIDYIPRKKIAEKVGINISTIYSAEHSDILSENYQYLKKWQKFAVDNFKSKIKEIESAF